MNPGISATVERMAQAFDDLLSRLAKAYPHYYPPQTLAEMRAAWPLERLMEAHAQVWFNGEMLTLRAHSSFSSLADPDAFQVHLAPDADDASVGAALVEVWAHSGALTLSDLGGMLNMPTLQEMKARHDRWLQGLMQRHGYKTARKLLTNMRLCRANRLATTLDFEANDHDRLDGWSGIAGLAHVVLPRDVEVSRLGAAVREALSLCRDSHQSRRR